MIFTSWLHYCTRHRLTEVGQTLHEFWLSAGLVHYLYIFGRTCPLAEFYYVQYSLCIQVLHSPILAGLLHGTWAVGISQTAAFSRGRHLYSAGQPSHWASAHILVYVWTTVMHLCLFCMVHHKFSDEDDDDWWCPWQIRLNHVRLIRPLLFTGLKALYKCCIIIIIIRPRHSASWMQHHTEEHGWGDWRAIWVWTRSDQGTV